MSDTFWTVARGVALGVVLGGALTGAACVAEQARMVGAQPTQLWEHSAGAASLAPAGPLSHDEAVGIALAHDAAFRCELTARALRTRDREQGFAVMEQCVLRPDFTDLESLLSPPWIDDLRARPDAARLVAHVIAQRGGDVDNDLRLCRRARFPLFSLRAAVAEPESYRGRYVLMLGTPSSGRGVNGARTLELTETRIMAESEWVSAGPRLRTAGDAAGDEPVELAQRTTRGAFRRSEGEQVEILHNVSVETGRTVLADASDDPFLEAGTDYVVLLRFDGELEVASGSILETRPVATVVASFEPSSGLFARLGR